MSDPFPVNEQLARLVAQARAVPTPNVSVTSADIEAALRGSRSWRAWLMPALASAATVVLGIRLWGGGDPPEVVDPAPDVAVATLEPGGRPAPPEAPSVESPRSPVPPVPPSPSVAAPAIVAGLGAGVTVSTISGEPPRVSSRWDVTVAAGVYRITLAMTASSTLRVHSGDRILHVEPGATVLLDNGESTVQAGQATWVESDQDKARRPGELAIHAERALARGDRRAAITALTMLVRSYPRAPETRTGLVDLARLRTATGDEDRARCAYELALKRWPTASTAPDVRRALDRLGAGPPCRGLTPKR